METIDQGKFMTTENETADSQKGNRNLTDADVRAIAAEVIRQGEPAVQHWFYSNLGRGLWGVIWKAIVVSLVGLAAYGAAGGHKPWA